jgi:hypothetical protein
MKELLKLEINEFILRIPEAYLRVSKGGRLDFPGRMIVCPGNGWMSDNCNVCLHHYLFIVIIFIVKHKKLFSTFMRSIKCVDELQHPVHPLQKMR